MFLPGWSFWCVLLTLQVSPVTSAASGYNSQVICLQGLSDCTVEDKMSSPLKENDLAVRNLNPKIKLCCRGGGLCALCLVIEAEIDVKPVNDTEKDDHSGCNGDNCREAAKRNRRASVKLCYEAVFLMPTCKEVQFVINHTQKDQPKFTLVIREPAGVSFSTRVTVYSSEPGGSTIQIDAPSLDEVCAQEQQDRVEQCGVPTLISVINQKMNWVELTLAEANKSLPSVCIQYETNGMCLEWNRRPIPLYSVTPCMCLQVWNEDKLRRSQRCPFVHREDLQKNVLQNVSVSMRLVRLNDYHSKLWWNLSAPCRLEGEVWPCHNEDTCRGMEGLEQQLETSTWNQNSKGQWEKKGVFEEFKIHLSPCVMVKPKGMDALDPFCLANTDRGRWSLLVVGLMLLVCLTVLAFYFLHDAVKEWAWSCRHGGFVKISSGGHVVLLSPPDVDHRVSESVCELGAQLRNRGFSVLVDQCSRKDQCNLGPLPWLHSQLMEMNSRGGTFVLVLTCTALNRAEGWAHRSKEVIKTQGDPAGLPEITSPYSDLFTASLSLIQAHKQLGRTGERFILVTLGPHPKGDRRLPELLRGLLLFQLPSQTKALLHELTVGSTARGSGGRTCGQGGSGLPSGGRTTSERASFGKCAEDEDTF